MKEPYGIQLKIDEEIIICKLLYKNAPLTCQAIVNMMPYENSLHYAKIAGEEIFFGIPLIMSIEMPTEVKGLSAGSVAYWPNRRVFCVYYGPPQEEAATVTVFGKITQNLEGLRRMGEEVRLKQGKRVQLDIYHSQP